MAFNNASALWDLSLPPSLPTLADDEFVALLQKQFGASNDGAIQVTDKQPPNGFAANINPQQLSRFPSAHDTSSPLSDDDEDSPSPSSANDNPRSRKQSGSMRDRQRSRDDDDDHAPKRKASEEDLDDEPNHKSQHTSNSKRASASGARRKSTGNTNADESRLLKRKEQNRAAQRAFRERKEKHVKDLEDKVAALEDRNQAAVSENESLREVIGRLQAENMKLRQSSFTFSMPPTSEPSKDPSSSTGNTNTDTQMGNAFNPPSSASTSSSSSTHDSPQSLFLNEKPDSSPLSIFNNPNLHVIDPEQTATGDAMSMGMDFGFGPVISDTPYTTLASNPLFMSFREPDVYAFGGESTFPQNHNTGQVNNTNNGGFDFSQNFPAWPDVNMDSNMPAFDLTNSLDELFGGSFNSNTNTMDYTSFIKNSPSTSISPVSHRNGISPAASISNSNSSSSSSSGASPASQGSPSATNNFGASSSSPSANGGQAQNSSSFGASQASDGVFNCDSTKKCTKEMLRHAVANDAGSMFAPKEQPSPPAIAMDGLREFIPCKNMKLPKTQKSDHNMEVMSAWRQIRTNPKYSDIDINKLCSEFAAKARCDGSQVVIEPDGMREILSTMTRRNGTPVNQA